MRYSQSTQQKHPGESDFLSPWDMQSPNKWHWKDQDQDSSKNIQQRDQAVEGGLVDANPGNAFVPDI